jgi:hypothetical protein
MVLESRSFQLVVVIVVFFLSLLIRYLISSTLIYIDYTCFSSGIVGLTIFLNTASSLKVIALPSLMV